MKQRCENEHCEDFFELRDERGRFCQYCGQAVTKLVDKADHNFTNGWQQITERLYFYFMNVVPPAFGPKNMFAVGEALRHNEQDVAVYTICARTVNRYWATEGTYRQMIQDQLGTIKENE